MLIFKQTRAGHERFRRCQWLGIGEEMRTTKATSWQHTSNSVSDEGCSWIRPPGSSRKS
jgi:hypothetical protein